MSSNNYEIPHIIVALDYNKENKALDMAKILDPSLCILKVGLELYVSCGPKIVNALHKLGYKIFLDLKFHDIKNTVIKSSLVAADLGVWMINVHSSGGVEMMSGVANTIKENNYSTLVTGVTVLTSLDNDDIKTIGYSNNTKDQVMKMAALCYDSGLNGIVCSAHEAKNIKNEIKDNFICVCPGIRRTEDNKDDQKRIMTPAMAANNGADYIVVGRPITNSKNPLKSLIKIKKEFNNTL
ncbi:MAG: orotidine-5'-phosphate decarboxylase [Gammaproteobacteria bacterium]|jgi:orotidine-5'-phosphate decarboxylase|nr:orotidine-5'-phosphate decarboxylase [Gammaproteobacteria bacterium]MBT6755298.1 orotidine-5'-phosphate decarboxylase [Gammaproteobacteria bacterium]MBT7814173.1 orotidine-5'-phosphate decarboxylase [Gammaproteobacteria bacterium]MDA9896401.1 orotidine-5'-phosphate decarboxylase [Gammaproteobacteria bacterium]